MNGMWDRIGSLVHPSAQTPVANMAHRLFIASRLLLGAAGVAFTPVYLALYGAPSLVETTLLALLLAPLATAMLASRTGLLVLCQWISCACMIAFGALLGLSSGTLSGAAIVWLILAPFEAVFVVDLILVAATCAAAIATVIGLHLSGLGHPGGASDVQDAVISGMVVIAVVYAGALAMAGFTMQRMRREFASRSAAQFRALTQAMGDFVLVLDRSGAVEHVSSERLSGLNLTARDLMARALFERVHVADRPAFLKAISDCVNDDSAQPVDLRLRSADVSQSDGRQGDPVFSLVEMRLRRLDAHGGGLPRAIAVLRDVADLRDHARQLEEARERAERASAWKDRFLANVSHELRTPLNAIIGFSEILASEDLAPADPKKRAEYASIIHSSGEHLLAVVNSILDISKIQAGSFDILSEPFDLAPLIDQCTKMVMLKAQESNISIVQDVPRDLDELVADKRAIKQVLINLLSNAVKFTPANGTVTISVRPHGTALSIAVADTGIGILAKDLARIGDPFFQARDSYDRPYEGTGLGLSVVRGLVGLHGGTMMVESGAGEGTRVTIRLPADCRQEPEARPGNIASIETIARGPAAAVAPPVSIPASLPVIQPSNEAVKKIA